MEATTACRVLSRPGLCWPAFTRPRSAAARYAWFRAHNLWLYETLYQEGNERVRHFLRPNGLVPFELRWHAVTAQRPTANT